VGPIFPWTRKKISLKNPQNYKIFHIMFLFFKEKLNCDDWNMVDKNRMKYLCQVQFSSISHMNDLLMTNS